MNDPAKAWKTWLSSDDGEQCANRETLGGAIYLQNRLWHAFMAGYEACEKSSQFANNENSPARDEAAQ